MSKLEQTGAGLFRFSWVFSDKIKVTQPFGVVHLGRGTWGFGRPDKAQLRTGDQSGPPPPPQAGTEIR